MSSETGGPGNELVLADRFDSCLTLLHNGESVEATLSRFPGSAAELRPLVETVENFRALPRYHMPATAGSALLGQMLAQNAQFVTVQTPAADGATPTQPAPVAATRPTPPQPSGFRFNWFGRSILVSKPLAAGAALLLVSVVILTGLVINNRSRKAPENEIAGVIQDVQPDRIIVAGQEIFIVPGETQLNNVTLQVGESVHITVKNVNGKTQAQTVQLSTDLPTVTPVSNILPTVTPIVTASASAPPSTTGPPATATVASTATPEANPTATPSPTATPPPPPGTEEQVEGNITEVIINNNLTIIVIDNRQYILDPEVVKAYGPRLKVGIYIKFKGHYNDEGRIIVINLIQIDTEVIVVAPPPQTQGSSGGDTGDNNSKDDKNHQSNGNCDAHSDNGKCNGPSGGNGKGNSGGNNGNGNGGGNNKGGGNSGNGNNKPKK